MATTDQATAAVTSAAPAPEVDTTATTPPPADEPLKQSARINTGPAFMEAAALLLVWSILVINEGAIRFNLAVPYDDLSAKMVVNRMGVSTLDLRMGVYFFGGLFEVIFGLVGLFVGGAALVFRFYNKLLTRGAMVVQNVLGWYVFIVFVFAQPAERANETSEVLGLSLGMSRFLVVLGLFTSFHLCLALQGGQFVFLTRLLGAAENRDCLMSNTGDRMRALFWNGNLALAGLWTFMLGSILNNRVEAGTFERGTTFAFPPHIGRSPALSIFVGLLMLLYGLFGMTAALMPKLGTGFAYYVAGIVVYVFAMLNFTIAQLGLLRAPAPAAIGMHNGLVFMIMVLGPYFVWRASQSAARCSTKHVDEHVV